MVRAKKQPVIDACRIRKKKIRGQARNKAIRIMTLWQPVRVLVKLDWPMISQMKPPP